MKLCYVTRKTFYPDSVGGAQLSNMYLFKELQSQGWEIEVLCASSIKKIFSNWLSKKDSLKFQDNYPVTIGYELGFKTIRRWQSRPLPGALSRVMTRNWDNWVVAYVKKTGADVVLTDHVATSEYLSVLMKAGIGCIKCIRQLPIIGMPSVVDPKLQMIGNSPYSAQVARATIGRDVEIVRPFINKDDYTAPNHEPRFITFVNPNYQKGIRVAVEVARSMPEQDFLIIKGKWSGFSQAYIDKLTKPFLDLENVTVWEHQKDMREVYAVTKVLLVPSLFIETFGRVIIEAQYNGIPVVGSDSGGIPYTIGTGGLVASPKNEAAPYVSAINQILENEETYRAYSVAAKSHANQPEFDPSFQVSTFLKVVEASLAAV